MDTAKFIEAIERLFHDLYQQFDEGEEYAFYPFGPKEINKLGYSTNLTPEIIEKAAAMKVNFILTHHDAWDFVYGLKEACHSLLEKYGIKHYFVHLPLDYAKFGTCSSLFKELGINELEQYSYHFDDRSMPGVGEFANPISFEELVERVEGVLQENVKYWKNSNKSVKRLGIITGAGHTTSNLLDASRLGCDAYITGEKVLYTVQFAQHIGLNLIVGSHTFTEIFGVKALAEKLLEQYSDLQIVELKEEHFE